MTILNGIKILDFSRLLPGPLATKQLLKMGAEVIKVEHPDKPELIKMIPPYINGISASYCMLNEDKIIHAIAYDTEDGKQQIYELVKEVDVVVESFRPGTMERLGFSYEKFIQLNPGIVFVSATSYGQDGPYSHLAGHDLNFMALSGLLSLNTYEDKIVVPSFQLSDLYGGSQQVVNAVLLGIVEKMKRGKGGWYDISITESTMPMASLIASSVWQYQETHTLGLLNGKLPNYTVYQCKDNKYLVFAGLEPKFWKKFCQRIDKPEWALYNLMELVQKTEIKQELGAMFRTKSRDAWIEYFQEDDICITPVYDLNETTKDIHFVTKNTFETSNKSNIPKGWNLGIRKKK